VLFCVLIGSPLAILESICFGDGRAILLLPFELVVVLGPPFSSWYLIKDLCADSIGSICLERDAALAFPPFELIVLPVSVFQ